MEIWVLRVFVSFVFRKFSKSLFSVCEQINKFVNVVIAKSFGTFALLLLVGFKLVYY